MQQALTIFHIIFSDIEFCCQRCNKHKHKNKQTRTQTQKQTNKQTQTQAPTQTQTETNTNTNTNKQKHKKHTSSSGSPAGIGPAVAQHAFCMKACTKVSWFRDKFNYVEVATLDVYNLSAWYFS